MANSKATYGRSHDFPITGDNQFVCAWRLRSGRTVAVLHYDPDGAWILKGDSFGGWAPAWDGDEHLKWAEERVHAAYPHARRDAS